MPVRACVCITLSTRVQVDEWLEGKAVMAVRFLGTTPGSSTIGPLLTSVVKQMTVVYDQPLDDIPEELSPLIQHFKKILNAFPTGRD